MTDSDTNVSREVNSSSALLNGESAGVDEQKKSRALATYSHNLVLACDEAEKWLGRNSELVRNEQESLLKDLRHARRVLRKCEKAATKKICAGVFGPSQAGKSYLISQLATGPDNTLYAQFADECRNFVEELNPFGGQESTGLVTRFTMTRPEFLPDGYPVQLALLSEIDLVKIIANAYYADFEHKEQPVSNIGETLEQLKGAAGAPNDQIKLDDLEDLREYLQEEFGAKARVKDLERVFWPEALALGPRLDLEGRVRLYALIWDEVEKFTDLLRHLLRALDSLGHAETVFASLDTLLPRESSIINVKVFDELMNPDDRKVKICLPDNQKRELAASDMAALTAELTIVMRDRPASYFEYTDLLDFPGYRSRHKLTNPRRDLEKPDMLRQLFIRGKVAYLFQRYCAERDLNNMLLCIGPSNQEVQDLPGVINTWIASTHGETPEERLGKQISLFFVLTQFDVEFKKKGEDTSDIRWINRLEASLLNFFGKGYDWPTHWTPQQGFRNIFLLRNTKFKIDLYRQDENSREIEVDPAFVKYMDALQNSFVNCQLVKNHFDNPGEAWKEVLRMNDGGISHIRQSLKPLCDPEIKRRQLLDTIRGCTAPLARRLSGFYKTDDKDEERNQKAALMLNLWDYLGALEEKQQRLGQLLQSFTISDNEIYDLYPEAMRRLREEREKAQEKINADETDQLQKVDASKISYGKKNPFMARAAAKKSATGQPTNPAPLMDEDSFYAAYIEAKWVEAIHKLADNADAQTFFMLPPKMFSALASELATGAARLGFKAQLTDAFRKISSFANTRKDNIVRKQATIAARIINDYVDLLGFHPQSQSEEERTITDAEGNSFVVFSPQQPLEGLPVLPEESSSYTVDWFADWTTALGDLIMKNVNFDGEQTMNVAENMALGSILKNLEKEYV